MILKLVFVLFLISNANCYFILENEDSLELTWPETYYIKGEKISLTTGFIQTFEYWYNTFLKKSREDYYGGTFKYYYFWGNDDNITYTYKIFSYQDGSENKTVCIKDLDFHFKGSVGLLPEPSVYQYIGDEKMSGTWTQKWSFVTDDEDQKVTNTLWTYLANDSYIPIRYEVQEYNSWNQSLINHVITEYYDYYADIDEYDLDVEPDIECEEVPIVDAEKSNELMLNNPNNEKHLDEAFNIFKLKHVKKYKNEKRT